MAIHNWNRVNAGLFHDFHQAWTTELRNALNAGVLPAGYFALAEQILGGPTPDVVTLSSAGLPHTAYVEPVAVGDPLPALPIFLGPDTYVPAPLEATYQTTWDKSPAVIKQLVETTV